MSYLDRIMRCSPPSDLAAFVPFEVDGQRLGLITPSFATLLGAFATIFHVGDDAVGLNPRLETPDERTHQVNAVLRLLADQGEIPPWRDEMFPVTTAFDAPAAFNIGRSAVSHMGVRAFGVHVNGFVRTGDGLKMWIGVRAKDIRVEPGKFDQMVAGGQGAGLGLMENVIKESAEEAAIPEDIAMTATSVGTVSYTMPWGEGVRRDTLFTYDLELPKTFVPHNADQEMQGFELWPIEQVAAVARDTDDFKFNCSLVVIDFLVRHGYIEATHPDFQAIQQGLHQPLDI